MVIVIFIGSNNFCNINFSFIHINQSIMSVGLFNQSHLNQLLEKLNAKDAENIDPKLLQVNTTGF